MIIAKRVLTLRNEAGERAVPIRIYAPEEENGGHWVCRYEIEWPDHTVKRFGVGIDAVQALVLALQIIGAELYTSPAHEAGRLSWAEGSGYGFPLAKSVRDLAVGEDKELT